MFPGLGSPPWGKPRATAQVLASLGGGRVAAPTLARVFAITSSPVEDDAKGQDEQGGRAVTGAEAEAEAGAGQSAERIGNDKVGNDKGREEGGGGGSAMVMPRLARKAIGSDSIGRGEEGEAKVEE